MRLSRAVGAESAENSTSLTVKILVQKVRAIVCRHTFGSVVIRIGYLCKRYRLHLFH